MTHWLLRFLFKLPYVHSLSWAVESWGVLKITVVAAARRMPQGASDFFDLHFLCAATLLLFVCLSVFGRRFLLPVTVNKKVRRIGDAYIEHIQIGDASPQGSVWEKKTEIREKSKLNFHPSKSGESQLWFISLLHTLFLYTVHFISTAALNNFLLLQNHWKFCLILF